MPQMPKAQPKKEESKPEPLKALPPYTPWHKNWLVLSVGIALIAVAVIIYFQMPKGNMPQPTIVPTAPVHTSTPTALPTEILQPTATEAPIPTSKPVERVRCGPIAKSVVLTEDLFSQGSCLTVKSEDVTIDCNGFKLTGEQNKSSIGIFSNYSRTTIRNCEISKYEVGISLKKADSSVIEDSSFVDNLGSLFIEASGNIRIINNKFLKTQEGAMRFWNLRNSTIENNFIDNNLNYGMYFTASDNNFVRSNSIYRSNIGLQLAKSEGNEISQNNFTGNGGAIKFTEESTNNLVEKNIIQSSKGVGIHLLFSSGNTLRENTVTKNEYGMNVYDSVTNLEFNYVCGNSIEDVECHAQQNAVGNICYTRATTCGFECVMRCTASRK